MKCNRKCGRSLPSQIIVNRGEGENEYEEYEYECKKPLPQGSKLCSLFANEWNPPQFMSLVIIIPGYTPYHESA